MPDHQTINRSITTNYPEQDRVATMVEYYEKKVGKTLTPIDYEKLKDFADTYPDGWFEKAIDEHPDKPLSYLEKVMESRQKEGASGTHRKGSRQLRPRDSYTPSSNEGD